VSIALESEAGPKADVPRKLRITDDLILRTRAMTFYRHRLDGMTDAEIGRLWGRSRQYVNQWINALTAEQRAQVRRDRLRSIRADHLLREEEMSRAV
jgi:transposase